MKKTKMWVLTTIIQTKSYDTNLRLQDEKALDQQFASFEDAQRAKNEKKKQETGPTFDRNGLGKD